MESILEGNGGDVPGGDFSLIGWNGSCAISIVSVLNEGKPYAAIVTKNEQVCAEVLARWFGATVEAEE